MTVTLSSKGQVVLPKMARTRLQLRPGNRFACRVEGDSIILTLQTPARERPKLVLDPATGLRITRSPSTVKVSNEDVRAALADFP
jgi:AbrB family looped-hinge helix DNA binding protein